MSIVNMQSMGYEQLVEFKNTIVAASTAITDVAVTSNSLEAVTFIKELNHQLKEVGTAAIDEIDRRREAAAELIAQ